MRGRGMFGRLCGPGASRAEQLVVRNGKDAEVGVVVDDAWGARGHCLPAPLGPCASPACWENSPAHPDNLPGRLSHSPVGPERNPDRLSRLAIKWYSSPVDPETSTPTPRQGTPTPRPSFAARRKKARAIHHGEHGEHRDGLGRRERQGTFHRGERGGCGEKLMGERRPRASHRDGYEGHDERQKRQSTRAERGDVHPTAHSNPRSDFPFLFPRLALSPCPLCSR